MYLTPSQYRARNYGVDVSTWTDAQVAGILHRAAVAIHAVTAAPTIPQPHDFRGGTITGESHTWLIDPYGHETRRVFLFHRPVKAVSLARIYATGTQYAQFDADEIYYEPSEGWIEPISANLTSYGLFGAAVLPQIGLSQPHLLVNYTYGRRIEREERLYYSDAGFIWAASSGSWSQAVGDEPEVRVNGSVRPGTDYQIDYVEGTVKFIDNHPVDGDSIDVAYVTGLHPDIPEAQGLIATAVIADRQFVSAMGGLRRLTVAELTLERGSDRSSGQTREITIPAEAMDLLEPFVFRSVAFA